MLRVVSQQGLVSWLMNMLSARKEAGSCQEEPAKVHALSSICTDPEKQT